VAATTDGERKHGSSGGPPDARSDRVLALALCVAFLVISSALSLALLRRPVHDTQIGLLPFRIWAGDVVRAGDWPLWYPYTRYGVPLTTLHLASNVFSPLGLALGAIFPYNVWTLAVEQLLWRCVGLAGAYSFARPHLRSSLAAAAAGCAYAGSGTVVLSTASGVVYPGLMVAPWLVAAADGALRARNAAGLLRPAGIMGLSLGGLVLNGYPGTWLTAPVLIAPYLVWMSGGRPAPLLRLAGASALGAVLAAGMAALFIRETLTVQLFGGAARNAVETSQGTLPLRELFGFLLVNPTYVLGTRPGDVHPQYVGIVPALFALLRRPPLPWTDSRAVRVALLTSGGALVTGAAMPRLLAAAAAALGDPPRPHTEIIPGEVQLLAGVALVLLGAIPAWTGRWERVDGALWATLIATTLAATPNPLGDVLRAHVPPFSILRWHFLHAWLLGLVLPVLGWRAAEDLLRPRASSPAPAACDPVAGAWRASPAEWQRRAWGAAVGTVALAAIVALGLPQSPELFPDGEHPPERMSAITLWWTAAVAFLTAMAAALLSRRGTGPAWLPLPLPGHGAARATLCLSGVALAGALGAGWLLYRREDPVRAFVPLPPDGRGWLDVVYVVAVGAALLVAMARVRNARLRLQWLAAIAIVDVGVAGSRFVADAMVVVEQGAAVQQVTRAFTFSGARRFPDEPHSTAILFPALEKRPTMGVWQALLPEIVELDRRAGTPSVFVSFALFPPRWQGDVASGNLSVEPSDLRAEGGDQTLGAGRPASGTFQEPSCASGLSHAEAPRATVTRLLSSVMTLEVRSACQRLLVMADTWAPAWRATIDGAPVPVIRVSGALRGVMLPAGEHVLEWRYRPAHTGALLALMGGSTAIAVALVFCPVRAAPTPPLPRAPVQRPAEAVR
jgi:hypothetical protein